MSPFKEVYAHHHQMAILGPVDHRLLSTLEVHKPLPAGLDVKPHTANNRLTLHHFFLIHGFQNNGFIEIPGSVPALDHVDVVLLIGDATQLCQGLEQVVTLQNQIPLKEQTSISPSLTDNIWR